MEMEKIHARLEERHVEDHLQIQELTASMIPYGVMTMLIVAMLLDLMKTLAMRKVISCNFFNIMSVMIIMSL